MDADRPFALEPLFTRDPRHIGEVQILMAMMAIRGVYERHRVSSLNHGDRLRHRRHRLLLPTYGERLGLKGKFARHWMLNPHPTLIPAIESGWVESIHCFGGEVGMERYIAARPGRVLHRRRRLAALQPCAGQLAGQYAVDMFIGSTLQIDGDANSSTVTDGWLAGFGGAPNMGHDPHGRRHASRPGSNWPRRGAARCAAASSSYRWSQTFQEGGVPTFVETLDAVEVGARRRHAHCRRS